MSFTLICPLPHDGTGMSSTLRSFCPQKRQAFMVAIRSHYYLQGLYKGRYRTSNLDNRTSMHWQKQDDQTVLALLRVDSTLYPVQRPSPLLVDPGLPWLPESFDWRRLYCPPFREPASPNKRASGGVTSKPWADRPHHTDPKAGEGQQSQTK